MPKRPCLLCSCISRNGSRDADLNLYSVSRASPGGAALQCDVSRASLIKHHILSIGQASGFLSFVRNDGAHQESVEGPLV